MLSTKIGATFKEKLSKLGVCLGLAGVSATAVACYGPPANIESVRQNTIAKYEAMCGGASCEAFCQQQPDSCTNMGATRMEPCDRNAYEPIQAFGGKLYVCNENWRIQELDCHDKYAQIDGKWACAENNADSNSSTEPVQEDTPDSNSPTP